MKKLCKYCDKEVVGRKDKIFCSQFCYNKFYYYKNIGYYEKHWDNYYSSNKEGLLEKSRARYFKYKKENYRELLDEVDERIPDRAALKAFLTTINSQEARDVIYGTAMEEVMTAPSTNHEQSDFLAWLKEEWVIQVQE